MNSDKKNCEKKSDSVKDKGLPEKDILTTVGEQAWKSKDDKDSINADEMFDHAPIAGSAGVEC